MEEKHETATFTSRLFAHLLDVAFIYAITLVGVFTIGLTSDFVRRDPAEGTAPVYLMVFYVLVYFAYFLVPVALYGQTLGKRLMQIQVVKAGGQPPGWGGALLREVLGKPLSGLTLLVGYLMVLGHPERRALHDLVAGTWVVVRRRPR